MEDIEDLFKNEVDANFITSNSRSRNNVVLKVKKRKSISIASEEVEVSSFKWIKIERILLRGVILDICPWTVAL